MTAKTNLEKLIEINHHIYGFSCQGVDWRGKELIIHTDFGNIIYGDHGVAYDLNKQDE